MHSLRLLYYWFVRTLLYFLPDAPLIMRFRGFLYSLCMQNAGKNFQVAHNVTIVSAEGLSVGNNVYIAYGCVIIAEKDVYIGEDVMFGPLCVLSCSNHSFQLGSFRYGPSKYSPVQVCDNSWVGSSCTILAGACLPKGCILASNSTLNKKYVVEDALYGGTPAQYIKKLNNVTPNDVINSELTQS